MNPLQPLLPMRPLQPFQLLAATRVSWRRECPNHLFSVQLRDS
jgi:hypothetical protein